MNYIISPHIDDAFLCLGGFFLNHFQKESFKIIHIFTRTHSTTRNNILNKQYEKDVDLVTQLRKDEERSIAALIGHDYECWDFLDRPLKTQFTPADHQRMRDDIAYRIVQTVAKQDTLFFPMGIMHEDHILIHDIGMDLYRNGYHVNFYEDMPYVVWDAANMPDRFAGLINLGFVPVCEPVEIQRKIEMLKHYGSQVRQDWLQSVEAYAGTLLENHHAERYWKSK